MDDTGLAVLVVSVVLERPTCITCISDKVGATKLDALRCLERMMATVQLSIERHGRCRACGSTVAPVFSVGRLS